MEQQVIINRPIAKALSLDKATYYEVHLSLVNALLPNAAKMTPKEIQVLARFMSFEGDIAEDDRFGTSARKIVKESLDLSDGGLGNYLKSLQEKQLLVKIDGKLTPRQFLEVNKQEQVYNFKLINNEY